MCHRVKGGLDNALGGLWKGEREREPRDQNVTCLSTL